MRISGPFAALLLTACTSAQAQPVESFYRGKTVNLIIGYPPAGANDTYARLVARHLGRYIPGNPSVVARNLPGAGSLIAASRIFNAEPKDGTTLGLLSPTVPLDEKLESAAAKYLSTVWMFASSPSCFTVSKAGSGFQMPGTFRLCPLVGQSIASSSQSGSLPSLR